jgi:hypothetical protein
MVDTTNSSQSQSSIFIDFLDPLFAVAIGIGFQNGILLEPWLQSWAWPKSDELFRLFVFVLGMLTIALSWFGYHQSIRNKPLESNGRFILDIELLILYILLLFQYKSFGAVLFILAAIYLSFIVWDVLKVIEHTEAYTGKSGGSFKRYARELITVQWFIFFAVLSITHHFSGDSYYLLIGAYLGIVLYRIDKSRHFLGMFVGWLTKRRT